MSLMSEVSAAINTVKSVNIFIHLSRGHTKLSDFRILSWREKVLTFRFGGRFTLYLISSRHF